MNDKSVFSFIFLSLIYLFCTTIYYNYEESLIYGAADGASYIEISKNSPFFAEDELRKIHAQRFLIPYLIGLISKIIYLDIYSIYRLLNFFLIFFSLYILIKIFKTSKIDNITIIIALSLIIFNPYLFRYFLSLPTLINDFFFIFSSLLIIYGIKTNNKNISYVGFALSIIARQTGIMFLISVLILKMKYKNNFFFSNFDLLKIVIIYLLIISLNNHYALQVSSYNAFDLRAINGIFFYLKDSFDLKETILFFSYFLFSYLPLLIFFSLRKINKKYDKYLFIYICISILLIFLQPILAGPEIAGKNIIRLTNLAYFIVIILFSLFYNFKNISFSKNILYIFILGSLVWSLHPTYNSLFNLID